MIWQKQYSQPTVVSTFASQPEPTRNTKLCQSPPRTNAPHVYQIQAVNYIRIVKYYKKQLCWVKILNLLTAWLCNSFCYTIMIF